MKTLDLMIGLCCGLAIGYFTWNDMRFQRDVALTTADWCRVQPEGWRCVEFLKSDSPEIQSMLPNYFYHDEN